MSDSFELPSRRSVLKASGASLVAAGLAASGIGSVAAQEQEGDGFDPDADYFVEGQAMEGLMFSNDFQSSGLFTIASPVIDYRPEVDEVEDEWFDAYNMRTIRYIRPNTRNVPLFPQDEAPIGTFEEEFGFVVDDDYVNDNDELVLADETIAQDGLDNDELSQLRPTIFALEPEAEFFDGQEQMVDVRFSPVPEESEEQLYNEFETEIFGGRNPFQPGGGGALDGTPTPTPSGGN